jgi:hypothetical protein
MYCELSHLCNVPLNIPINIFIIVLNLFLLNIKESSQQKEDLIANTIGANTSPTNCQNLSREWICILLIVFIIEEEKDDQAAEKAARAHFE